jgi:hypothetical protein
MRFNEQMKAYILNKYKMNVDQYVAKKLHYESVDDLCFSEQLDELGNRKPKFAKEQIDAIATAIYSYEEKGDAIIVADQTGVGKGRIVAGLIKYAIEEKGVQPIFFTEKKHLINDIYRDLVDIGYCANVPIAKIEKREVKKEDWSDEEVVKIILKDIKDEEDLRIDYSISDDLELSDLKKYGKEVSEEGSTKEDEKIKKIEEVFDELIPLYRQHLLENGDISIKYIPVPKDIYDEQIRKEISLGKKTVRPFFPSRKDIVNKDGDVLYYSLTDSEVKESMGFYKDEKGKWAYDYEMSAKDIPNLSNEFSLVTLPYSQANELYESAKKTGGRQVESPKFRFYKKIATDNVIILDEAHTAAGSESNTGVVIRTMLDFCSMTTFVSATYAKTENNMPLYASKTSMREAGLSNRELIEVFSQGGVALQEAVSAELTRNGQLVRREKRIQGYSEYLKAKNELSDEVGTRQALKLNQIAGVFKDVLKFQSKVSSIVKSYRKSLPERTLGQSITGTQQEIKKARSTKALTFQMFNFFLLGIKVQQTSKVAVEKLNSGRKCVITIANTMESALNNMPKTFRTMKESDRYKVGDTIENDFKLYIAYLLFYTMRWIKVEEVIDDEGNVTLNETTVCVFDDNHRLSATILSELSDEYNTLLNKILAMSTGISIAPIDEIKSRIKAATDYSIDEITGRNLCVYFKDNDYSKGTIQKRNIKDTTKLVKAFNDNEVDALFINQSGAVGISMHPVASGDVKIAYKTAKEKMFINDVETDVEVGFPTTLENKKEIKKRCMIVTQMELDINKEVQKLGRISRTGQVYEPEYIYIISSIPSEARISAMMEKKLRSLSANVSGNQEQSAYLFEADDFFGEIAIIPFNETMKAMGNRLEITRKEEIQDYTKLLYFDEFNNQEDFYRTFSNKLSAHIKEMERLGAYTGKVDKKDYKAEVLNRNIFYIGDENSRTSFGRHGFIEKSKCIEFQPKNLEHDIKDSINSHLSIVKKDENGVVNTQSFNSIPMFKAAISERLSAFKSEKNSITEILVKNYLSKIEANKNEIKSISETIEDMNFIVDAVEKEEKLKTLNDKKSEITKGISDSASSGDFVKLGELTTELQKLTVEINSIDEEVKKFGDISEKKSYLNAQKKELNRLKKQQEELNEDIEDAYKSQTDYLSIVNLVSDYIAQIGVVGVLSNYKETFVEDASEEGDEQRYSSYSYEKIAGHSVVITGVKFDALEFNDLTRSSVNVYFTGVLDNYTYAVSQLNPRVTEKDKKLHRKPIVKFDSIDQQYNGYWNEEIAIKQDASIKKEKWFAIGSTLINYPLTRRSGNIGNIIKYTEVGGIEKLGIEITDIEFRETRTSTYKILEQNYIKNDDHSIYFDGNKKNIENFIVKYIAEKTRDDLRIYKTNEYPESYDRYRDLPKFYFQQSFQDKFIIYEFSINKNENRFFSRMKDIVSYGFEINRLKKREGTYDSDNYYERNKKYYEQELGGVDAVLQKVEKLLNEEAENFCSLNFDVKIFTTEAAVFTGSGNFLGIANILNDSGIVQIGASNFNSSGKSNFEQSGYTIEADIKLKNRNEYVFLTDSKIQSDPQKYRNFKNYIKLSFVEFMRFMDFCQEKNAKPMFSTSKKIFESCKDVYILEQFLDETKNTIEYAEEKTGDVNFREEIKNKIEKLVKLFT